MISLLDVDRDEKHLLNRLTKLEKRISDVESLIPGGLFPLGNTTMTPPGDIETEYLKITDEYIAVSLTAGVALVKGNVVAADTAADRQCVLAPTSSDDPIGIVEADADVGESVWIIVAGVAEVLFDSATTPARDFYVYTSTATAGQAAGQAGSQLLRHIGHCIETPGAGAGGLARCVLQFN